LRRTCRAPSARHIAVVPVGYADGTCSSPPDPRPGRAQSFVLERLRTLVGAGTVGLAFGLIVVVSGDSLSVYFPLVLSPRSHSRFPRSPFLRRLAPEAGAQQLLDRQIASLAERGVTDGTVLVVDHETDEILVWANGGGFTQEEGGQSSARPKTDFRAT